MSKERTQRFGWLHGKKDQYRVGIMPSVARSFLLWRPEAWPMRNVFGA
jgi:hypothetical protein